MKRKLFKVYLFFPSSSARCVQAIIALAMILSNSFSSSDASAFSVVPPLDATFEIISSALQAELFKISADPINTSQNNV